MSRVTNEVFMMRFKAFKANLLTVAGLLVEPSTVIAKPKISIEASLDISQPPIIVIYINTVIYPSLSSFLFSDVC